MFLSISNSQSKIPILLTLFPFLFAAKCRKDEQVEQLEEAVELKQDIFEASTPELTVQVLGMDPDTVELGQTFRANVSGIGFQDGAEFFLGEEPIYVAEYENDNTYILDVPPQNLGVYDLRIVNPSGDKHTLRAALFVEEGLNGFVDGVQVNESVFPEHCTSIVLQFGLDEDRLNDTSKETLKTIQECFQLAGIRFTIEGHADERGTTDYNLALGERRAQAVRQYLQLAGVSAAQLETISYGEESPIDKASTEEAWEKNRRAVINMGE